MAAAFEQRFNESESPWPAPDMGLLSGGRITPPTMPPEMFGSLWPLVCDLAKGAGAPVDYAAVDLIGVAASLIGAKRRVQPFVTTPQWQEPCVLWIAKVGDPSSNKSPAQDAATDPLKILELEYAENHKYDLYAYEAKRVRAKAEKKAWEDSVTAAVKDKSETPPMPEAAAEPERPQRRRFYVRDTTPEALGVILAGNPLGTLHLRDELSGWLMSFERYSPGGREFWLEAYGGRSYVFDRKSLEVPLEIPFNGVSVLGGIQPEKLVDCLLNTPDDGLVARFLWTWPDALPYSRPQNIAEVAKLERLYRRLNGIEPPAGPSGSGTALLLSEGAGDIFEAWVAENDQSVKDAASLYKGFCGKLRGIVLRLALVVEMLAWAASHDIDEPREVSAQSTVAAIRFIEEYGKPTAIRVFGDAALPESDRNAALLAKYILKTKATRINGREIKRSCGIPSLKKPDAFEDAAEVLVDAGWLKGLGQQGAVGRPSKSFSVNPLVHEPNHG